MRVRGGAAAGKFPQRVLEQRRTLGSNGEITELLDLVVAHGEANPLGSDRETIFKDVDLLRLFRFSAERRINFITTPVERVINESGARASTD